MTKDTVPILMVTYIPFIQWEFQRYLRIYQFFFCTITHFTFFTICLTILHIITEIYSYFNNSNSSVLLSSVGNGNEIAGFE